MIIYLEKLEIVEVTKVKYKMNIADAVTTSRIIFAVFVLACSTFSVQFYIFYFLAAFTDMIDGWIARKLELKSSFGAQLDTVADFIFVAVVLIKVLPVIHVPRWLWIWAALIAVIKLTNLVSSFVMFHRLISIHSVMNKITGFILFLLPFSIGRCSWQIFVITVIVACSIATFAAIQEGHFIRTGKEIE